MEIKSKVGKYLFLSEPFHCDFSNRLFIGHLGNHMLNAADFHSNERGFGMNYLNTIHKTWVLSRLAIEIQELPLAYSQLCVETWVDNVMRFFTNRNFKVSDAATGKIYAYGSSVWAMIDTQTRQPANILAVHNGAIANYIDTETTCPIKASARIKPNAEATLAGTVETHYSDVDINGHINSVKYIEHLLDLMNFSWHNTHRIIRLDVAYVAESHWADRLYFYREATCQGEDNYRITKQTSKEEPVEVCRIKMKYVSLKE